MSEYIDKNEAINGISDMLENEWGYEGIREDVYFIFSKIPPAKVRPVVYGEWIWDPNGMDFNLGAWLCSKCSCRNNNLPLNKNLNPLMFSGSNFCPNCGADMRGEKK